MYSSQGKIDSFKEKLEKNIPSILGYGYPFVGAATAIPLLMAHTSDKCLPQGLPKLAFLQVIATLGLSLLYESNQEGKNRADSPTVGYNYFGEKVPSNYSTCKNPADTLFHLQ